MLEKLWQKKDRRNNEGEKGSRKTEKGLQHKKSKKEGKVPVTIGVRVVST